MYLLHSASQIKKAAVVKRIAPADLVQINNERFVFDWSNMAKDCELYQLNLINDDEILGIMAIKDSSEQHWIEIKLLESSMENVGRQKEYQRIAGTLMGFACREAVKRHAPFPCVSLVPKTILKEYYILKYGMLDGSKFLYLDEEPLLHMVKKYYYGS
ncbi:hypothetical protein [Pedobacter africanus]|uniref:N-acetyltransferase domain-containing protein n=1 Tax=Pedobacter africanus TaxID=151894 RepID=A0A1W1Z7W4_9SPHI|nr:hypothetical protein [Pedobacter africanus]SMC44008.1 hypothetical protein SAMN04488524_0416 [Pedobacter africanus]